MTELTTIEIIITIFIFMAGLAVGSFLNVVALRLLSNEDFVKERSKCPHCGEKIAWYDNIPLLSFLLLRGKCRHCSQKISCQYPLVELVTGILFAATYLKWGYDLKTLFLLFFIANLVVITLTDLKEQVIFDMNSVPLIPIGLGYNFFDIGNVSEKTVEFVGIQFNDIFISALIGAILGVVFFEFFSRLGYVLSGEYAFGGGDTILGAAFGAWFGWKALIIILILSLVIQMIVGIPLIVYNLYKTKEYKSLVAMGGLFAALLLSIFGRILTHSGEFAFSLAVILIAFIIGGISVFALFKRMRETQNYTFMPFGPPLVLAAIIVMFLDMKITFFQWF